MALTGSPRERAIKPRAPAPSRATRAQARAVGRERGAIGREEDGGMAASLESGPGGVNPTEVRSSGVVHHFVHHGLTFTQAVAAPGAAVYLSHSPHSPAVR